MRVLRMIGYLLFFGVLIAFAQLNKDGSIALRYSLDRETPAIPVIFVVLGAMLVGFVFAFIYGLFDQAKLRRERRRLEGRVRELDAELMQLRTMPFSEATASGSEKTDENLPFLEGTGETDY